MTVEILICAQQFNPPFIGGVDVYADRLARAFQRLGFETGIMAFDTDPSNEAASNHGRPEFEEQEGLKVWRLPCALADRSMETFGQAYDVEMGRLIRRFLEAEKPELFVILNFYLPTLAAVEAAKSLGIRLVHIATDFVPVCRRGTFVRWDGRGCRRGESIKSCSACYVSQKPFGRVAANLFELLPNSRLRRWANGVPSHEGFHPLKVFNPYWKQFEITDRRLNVLPGLREQIDLVLVPTRFTGEVFLANGFRSDQVVTLSFGIDKRSPLGDIEHEPSLIRRFLFIGRFQPYKGAHLLIEAFHELKRPAGATLTLYGAPDGHELYFDRLRSMIDSHPGITFRGKIMPSELPGAFAAADYFVLPSLWHENSPLILLDALQSRTPVIASRIAGVTDLVSDGNNGFLFPLGDRAALRDLMQSVIDDPSLGEDLSSSEDLLGVEEYARRILHFMQDRAGLDLERSLGRVPAI